MAWNWVREEVGGNRKDQKWGVLREREKEKRTEIWG